MNTIVKSALAAVVLSVIGAGAVLAAECCCKEMDCKMPCCAEKGDNSPKPAPAPDHKH